MDGKSWQVLAGKGRVFGSFRFLPKPAIRPKPEPAEPSDALWGRAQRDRMAPFGTFCHQVWARAAGAVFGGYAKAKAELRAARTWSAGATAVAEAHALPTRARRATFPHRAASGRGTAAFRLEDS